MANRYNFASTGAAAVDELTKMLAEREAQRQREFMNAITAREAVLNEKRESRIAEAQRQAQEDLEYNREFQRAARIDERAMPNDPYTSEEAAMLRKHGFGPGLRETAGEEAEAQLAMPTDTNVKLSGSALSPEQMALLDQELTGGVEDLQSKETKAKVAPGIVHRGGTKFLSEEANRKAKVEAANAAAAERAERDRERREFTEQQNQLNRDLRQDVANANRAGQDEQRKMNTTLRLSSQVTSDPMYRDMLDIESGRVGVEQGLARGTGFGDVAAINAFQRMIDPGATVRSEDVKLLQTASAWFQKLNPAYLIEKLKEGDKLPPAVREEMLRMTQELYARRANTYNETAGRKYKALADAAGIDFGLIGREFAPPQAAPTGAAPNAPTQSLKGQTKTTPHGTFVHDGVGWVKQ